MPTKIRGKMFNPMLELTVGSCDPNNGLTPLEICQLCLDNADFELKTYANGNKYLSFGGSCVYDSITTTKGVVVGDVILFEDLKGDVEVTITNCAGTRTETVSLGIVNPNNLPPTITVRSSFVKEYTADASGSTTELTIPALFNDVDGIVVEVVWSLVSGDSSLIIDDTNNQNAIISNLKVGNYVVKVRVKDNDGAYAEELISIEIKPAKVRFTNLVASNSCDWKYNSKDFILTGSPNTSYNLQVKCTADSTNGGVDLKVNGRNLFLYKNQTKNIVVITNNTGSVAIKITGCPVLSKTGNNNFTFNVSSGTASLNIYGSKNVPNNGGGGNGGV